MDVHKTGGVWSGGKEEDSRGGTPSSCKPAHSWKSPWRVNGATKLRLHPGASDVNQRYIRGGTLLAPTHHYCKGPSHVWLALDQRHQSPMEAGTSLSSSSWFSNLCDLPEKPWTHPPCLSSNFSKMQQHHHEPNIQHFSPSSPFFPFLFFPRTQNKKLRRQLFFSDDGQTGRRGRDAFPDSWS